MESSTYSVLALDHELKVDNISQVSSICIDKMKRKI